MKSFLIAVMALTLVACSGGKSKTKAPRNLDNACAFKTERADWYRELTKAQRKWRVPVASMMATIYQESKFDGEARTPLVYKGGFIPMGRRSSAYGFSQAIDSTWEWYQKETGNRRAKRNDFGDAVDFMGWYMNQSRTKNGIALNDTYNQYLAYHDGHAGFRRGTYRSKAWLPPVARSVQERAILYHQQLTNCR